MPHFSRFIVHRQRENNDNEHGIQIKQDEKTDKNNEIIIIIIIRRSQSRDPDNCS